MINTTKKSFNIDEIIVDLDIYARHYHVSGISAFRIQEKTPSNIAEAARRLHKQGLLSSLEDAQLTPEGFEIARQVCQSLAMQAGK